MSILNLIIAIVALVITVLAYQRSGGVKDLRQTTATLLAKMEQAVRKEEKRDLRIEKGEFGVGKGECLGI